MVHGEPILGERPKLNSKGCQQNLLVEKGILSVINVNRWALARRDSADACKAIGTKNPALKALVAHHVLEMIESKRTAKGPLKKLHREERFEQRQVTVKPME